MTPWTGARQAPLSMGFPRQEYWSGLPFPSPGDLLDSGIKSESLSSPALAGRFFTITSFNYYHKAKAHCYGCPHLISGQMRNCWGIPLGNLSSQLVGEIGFKSKWSKSSVNHCTREPILQMRNLRLRRRSLEKGTREGSG